MNERLERLRGAGQSVWIGSLSRDDIKRGNLQGMIYAGVAGITSNPTNFHKAISESSLYDEQLEELTREIDDPKEIFLQIAKQDIGEACDLFAPLYEETGRLDGYVSPEVSPDIAYDTVNTMPLTTLEATMDHTEIRNTLQGREGIGRAREFIQDLSEAGVDYESVAEVLEEEGVRKFSDSFDELLEEIRSKGRHVARR